VVVTPLRLAIRHGVTSKETLLFSNTALQSSKKLVCTISPPQQPTCPTGFVARDFIIVTFGKMNKSLNSSIRNFLHPPATSPYTLTSVLLATRQSFPPISNYSSVYFISRLGGEEGESMQESVTWKVTKLLSSLHYLNEPAQSIPYVRFEGLMVTYIKTAVFLDIYRKIW